MFAKKFSQMSQLSAKQNKCANVQKCAKHKCANLQMCKNRRAQNAQICSANIFPNAEITNLQMHKSALCTISAHASFRLSANFLCKFFFLRVFKIIY